MTMILKGEVQKQVRNECSKIFPVGNIEIRKTEILDEDASKKEEKSSKKTIKKETEKEN